MSSALRWILSSQRASGVWTRNICLAVSSTHSNRPGDTNSAVLRAMVLGLARKAGHALSTYNPRAQAYGHQPTSGVSPETQVAWDVWSEPCGKNILPPYLSWRILTSDTGCQLSTCLGPVASVSQYVSHVLPTPPAQAPPAQRAPSPFTFPRRCGLNCISQKDMSKSEPPRTSKCDRIWTWGPCRCN